MNNLQLKIILSAVDKLLTPMKRNLQGSKQLAAGLQQAKKYAQELNNQNLDVTKYRNLSRSIGITSNELKNARARAEELAKGINSTNAPTKAMIREFDRAKTVVNELQGKQTAQISQQQRLRETMNAAGINVKSLASEQRRLKSEMQSANQTVDEQRKKLDQLNDVQKRMNAAKASYQKTKELQGRLAGTGAGLVAGGTAVGATAVKPILEFAKAENSATELKVSMMGAGGVVRKEFGAINELATRLGNKLPGTTSDLQNMMSTLIQQGMTAKAILGGLGESTAYLAVQMKMPYDQAALFASKLQDATGTAEKDMMGLMDVIQRSHYLGVDSDNMLQAYAKMSPALSIIRKKGLEASKALAPLVVMADQSGMAGEASGNAYRKVFQMAMNTKKVHEANSGALAKTGVKLNFTDGHGEFAGIDKLMSELAKLKGLNTENRLAALKKIFGDDAETLQVLTILIDKGKAGYAEVQKKMADQADIQQRVNAQLGTLTNLWDAATGTFTNALVKFGESVSPEVKALTQWIGDISERIGNWSERHPVLSSGIMKTVAAVSALMIGMGGLSLAVAAILGPLAMNKLIFSTLGIKVLPILWDALKYGGGVFKWLSRLVLTNPLGLLVAGLATAAYLIWDNWDWIKGKFTEFFKWIDEKVKAVAKMAKEVYDALPDAFKTTIEVPKTFTPGDAAPWMNPATAGGPNFITQMTPVTAPKSTVNSTVVHAPITIVQQPGQNDKDLAAKVKKHVEDMQRNVNKRARGNLAYEKP